MLGLDGGASGRSDDHLVEASEDVAASEVLELLAGLEQQASSRNLHSTLGAIAGPDVETGEARASVSSQEVQVIVEASENSAEFTKAVEVRSSRGKQMGTKIHARGESVFRQVETNGGKLGNSEGGIQKFLTPSIHNVSPLGERRRDNRFSVQRRELGLL